MGSRAPVTINVRGSQGRSNRGGLAVGGWGHRSRGESEGFDAKVATFAKFRNVKQGGGRSRFLEGMTERTARATAVRLEGLVVEGGGVGAGQAEAFAVLFDEAIEVDAFAAAGAGYALAFVAREFAGGKRDADPCGGEEFVVGELAVGFHLLRVLVERGVEFAGAGLGGFEGYDAEGFVVVVLAVVGVEFEVEVDEGGGHLAEVAMLESSLAETAAGDDRDGIGSTAVDFDEGDQALAVGVEGAVGKEAEAGVVDAETREGEHGHADAEDLAGAEMAVGDFGFVKERVEGGGHDDWMLRDAWRLRGGLWNSRAPGASNWVWPIVNSQRRSGGKPG